ncbi:MAG TPA: hypothetical protein VEB21_05825, partial [Terriglobales bacterium]|nr:hypothetical protein [Terriglobales bacterium]
EPSQRACEIQVALCLNNLDPALPSCATAGVADSLRISRPRLAADPINAGRIAAALQTLRDPVTGAVGLPLPLSAAQVGICTEPFYVRVPLGRSHRIPGKVRIRTMAFALEETRPRRDRDSLTLNCQP